MAVQTTGEHFRHYADDHWRQVLELAAAELDTDAVHDIRVGCKRLRACWLLRRGADGEQRCRSEERRLREIAKQLGGQRDNDVAQETCKRLLKQLDDDDRRASLSTFLQLLKQRASTRIAGARVDVRGGLGRAHLVWQHGGEGADDTTLRRGLLGLYRRARRWWRRAKNAEGDDELQHRWRRWVKHLAFATEACGLLEEERKPLLKLGSSLGKRHDLAVLRGYAATLLDEEDRALVDAAILDEDGRLLERCRELGQRCFRLKRQELAGLLGL